MTQEQEIGKLFWVLVGIFTATLGTGTFVWVVEDNHRTLGAVITTASLLVLLALARREITERLVTKTSSAAAAAITWMVLGYLIYDHYQPSGAWQYALPSIGILCFILISLAVYDVRLKQRADLVRSKTLLASKLQLSEATWGNATNRVSVIDQINAMPCNALTFFVNPDNLGGIDPSKGDDGKYLLVKCMQADGTPSYVSANQGDWVMLPVDPQVGRMRKERAQIATAYTAETERLKADINVLQSKQTPSSDQVFRIQRMRADPIATDPKITFKNKLRFDITNISGKSIYVWMPLWESSIVPSQADPTGSRLLVERTQNSWQRGEWVQLPSGDNLEHCCAKLPPGFTFESYVGLLPHAQESVEGLLRRHEAIGTILLPIKIDGDTHEIRIPAREI